MRRFLFVLWFIASGTACAEEEPEILFTVPNDTHFYIDTSQRPDLLWMPPKPPECPDDFGPIVVEMPPGFGYETLHIDCGRIVSTVPDWCKSLHENCDDNPGWDGEECTCEWYRLRLASPTTEADE